MVDPEKKKETLWFRNYRPVCHSNIRPKVQFKSEQMVVLLKVSPFTQSKKAAEMVAISYICSGNECPLVNRNVWAVGIHIITQYVYLLHRPKLRVHLKTCLAVKKNKKKNKKWGKLPNSKSIV